MHYQAFEDALKAPRWHAPVVIDMGDGVRRIVSDAADASHLLEADWPQVSQREKAILLCRSATMRLVSPETARDAFIAACREAGRLGHRL